ncbi:hypothetical protein ACW9HQ_50920 [Nocardia gipuzkoensis]
MTCEVPCAVEIVGHPRGDGDAIVGRVEVIVNDVPMPATSEPRDVHTPLGTHVALDPTATSVNIRTETKLRDRKETP